MLHSYQSRDRRSIHDATATLEMLELGFDAVHDTLTAVNTESTSQRQYGVSAYSQIDPNDEIPIILIFVLNGV